MDLKPLNWAMIKNPINWITIIAMVFFGILALELFLQFFNVNLTNLNNQGA